RHPGACRQSAELSLDHGHESAGGPAGGPVRRRRGGRHRHRLARGPRRRQPRRRAGREGGLVMPMPPAPPPFLPVRRRAWLVLAAAALAMPSRAGTPAPRALAPRPLVFPRDHGSHNDTRTEWWYLTGHAQAEGAPDDAPPAWGFQVTFFRSRVDSSAGLDGRLAARQLLFAHAAITDATARRLTHAQRIARWNGLPPGGAPGPRAVFASETDTAVHLRGWSFVREAADGIYRARIDERDLAIDLNARPTQPLLLQGDQGFSRKGPD